jgi:hypothetical protein
MQWRGSDRHTVTLVQLYFGDSDRCNSISDCNRQILNRRDRVPNVNLAAAIVLLYSVVAVPLALSPSTTRHLVTPTVAVMTVVAALSPSQVPCTGEEGRRRDIRAASSSRSKHGPMLRSPTPRLASSFISLWPCLLPIFPLSTPFALLEVSPAVQLGSCRADNVQIVARPLSSGSCTLSGCP